MVGLSESYGPTFSWRLNQSTASHASPEGPSEARAPRFQAQVIAVYAPIPPRIPTITYRRSFAVDSRRRFVSSIASLRTRTPRAFGSGAGQSVTLAANHFPAIASSKALGDGESSVMGSHPGKVLGSRRTYRSNRDRTDRWAQDPEPCVRYSREPRNRYTIPRSGEGSLCIPSWFGPSGKQRVQRP